MTKLRLLAISAVSLVVMGATTVAVGTPYTDINAAAAASEITTTHIRGNLSMLDGSGGEMTVLSGPEGILMVDAGIAVSQKKIVAALHALSPGKLRYVVLTHWHWDHADGDGWVRQAGASIIADKHTVKHLSQTLRIVEWEHTFTPVPRAALPNKVVSGDKILHFAGETVRIRHYEPSHTDGDLSVYFEKADVLSTGDTFWNGVYPFIDYVAGGSIDGAISAANANLAIAAPHTLIVPGHGPLGDRDQLLAFRDMLVAIRGKVAALKAGGMTADQVVAAKPTADFDAKWGQSVVNGALFTRLVYRGV
jgi:glyoxylase-like metal-dependent hydrolase (beta-lactamase superfamily II)